MSMTNIQQAPVASPRIYQRLSVPASLSALVLLLLAAIKFFACCISRLRLALLTVFAPPPPLRDFASTFFPGILGERTARHLPSQPAPPSIASAPRPLVAGRGASSGYRALI